MSCESPLLFPVARLDEGENLFEIDVTPAELDLTLYKFKTDICCKILLTKTRERIDVQIDVSAIVNVECSRCQDSMEYPVHSSTGLSYLPVNQSSDSFEDTTDLEFYVDEIDLKGTVRDCFILGVPIAPLCTDDCKGLCPICGVNLNRVKCNCREDNKVSPFDDLRRLVDG